MSDIDTLKNFNCPENVIEHCIAVSKNAVAIANRVKIPIDKDLIRRGALLHDIGRCRTHGIEHGIEGGRIIRELGLPEELAKIAERHIGAGLLSDEARKLGLAAGVYSPESPEEKIVTYADNITRGPKLISFDESLKRFKKELGPDHPSIRRMENLNREIESWI